MAIHDAKPKDKTVGKNRMCLSCFHCRTKVFRNTGDLEKWCKKRECHFMKAWHNKLRDEGKVTIYWCTECYDKSPRILRRCDKPFVKNCKSYNGGG